MIQRSKQFVVTSQCIHTIQYYTHIYWWWLSTVFTSHMYTVNGRVLYVTSKHLPVYDINKTWNFGCYLRKVLAAIILKMEFLFHLSVKKTENISGLLTSVLSVECLSILLLYTVLYTHCTHCIQFYTHIVLLYTVLYTHCTHCTGGGLILLVWFLSTYIVLDFVRSIQLKQIWPWKSMLPVCVPNDNERMLKEKSLIIV